MRPALPPLLLQHMATIGDLCREFGVSSLEVFGSAADGRFDAACSDVDFIARFLDSTPGSTWGGRSLGQRYVGFAEALESLLGRRVDVLTDHAIANPYLRRAVDASRRPLYVASPAQASA